MSAFFSRLKVSTVRLRLFILLAVSFGVFILLMTIYSFYSVRIIRHQAAELSRNAVMLQCETIDTLFFSSDQYLISQSIRTEDFDLISNGAVNSESYVMRWRIIQELQNGNRQLSSVDGIFLYFPNTDEYISTAGKNTTYDQREAVKARIKDYLSEGLPSSSGWVPIEARNEYFFCRILQVSDGYIGIWSSTDTLISALKSAEISKIEYVVFVTESGQILDGRSEFREPRFSRNSDENYLTLNGQKYIVAKSASSSGVFSLMALMDEKEILAGAYSLYNIIIVSAACLIVVMMLVFSVMQASIITPLNSLVDTMNSIREGDIDAQIAVRNSGTEFQIVGNTFNSMMSEIKRLKLDIYEERLMRQKTRYQYYQLQIKPHFFMNSLNMIYQFAQVRNYDLVKRLSIHLSTYFRYNLKNDTEMVSLKDELAHVENYLEIQKIRYPYNLELEINICPEVRDELVPPLVIQTFIENSVKYAVSMDGVTKITLTVEKREGSIVIMIGDNGPGFLQEILGALEIGDRIFYDNREHIGIFNVRQRLWLIYGGGGDIRFGNGADGGARVEIWLPSGGKED